MKTIPCYNLLMLPQQEYCFGGDYFRELVGNEVTKGEEIIFLLLKENKNKEEMTPEDIYPIGMYGAVEKVEPEGDIYVRARERVNISELVKEKGVFHFRAVSRPDIDDLTEEAKKQRFSDMQKAYIHFMKGSQWGPLVSGYLMQWDQMETMISALGSKVPISSEEKYQIMAADTSSERYERMEKALYSLLEMLKVSNEAESALTEKNEKLYREDAIRKQIEFLQRELDDMHPESITDVRRFEKLIADSAMNEAARAEACKVLNRMKQEGSNSNEYGLLYDYLDFVTGLCWKKKEGIRIDLDEAERILSEDHYGMTRVKGRVMQQIAVMSLNRKQTGSILLFVGAPGTGKTSIGQSIARALGRKYVRVSLGGVRDEAEIRGHRRTYVGAMPGRIMDGIRKCGENNPVVVLDEVDKLSHDLHGDPSSALLEVLDPEQNATFTDHYMNVPYDLSDVFFVCTANTIDTIPEPLLNRMEVIEFPGYSASEKLQIARKHLLPKAAEAAGLKNRQVNVTDEALKLLIADYTAESGVRGLKKQLDSICRAAAVRIVRGDRKSVRISERTLQQYLFDRPVRRDSRLKQAPAGVVTGLAWTRAGGEILFVETLLTPGSGKLQITGKLGDVMKESVQIALSLVKARFPETEELFKTHDLHVHVPEGAVPKDGPSAGITLTLALASLVTGKPVDPELAMTGEISLRGRVLPIGGLPEKLMAASRAGITRVLIPKDNEKDLQDVPVEVREKLRIQPVETLEEVFAAGGIGISGR
ncbi:MAG: endopeptidase La [Lachnospiraceae bacterium]|nr:endopeptidase La [Lachnospiraceae bacterium]